MPRLLLLVIGALLAVLTASGAIAGSRGSQADPSSDILERLGGRVLSLDVVDGTVRVTGRASTGADGARTAWYQAVAGAALAQETGASSIRRRTFDDGGTLREENLDESHASGVDPLGPLVFSDSDIARGVGSRIDGARVLETNYIPLFGGIAEIILLPDNEAEFMARSGERIGTMLGEFGENSRPYLVTVVDSHLRPRLVLGFTPGLGGTMGQGLGWQADDVRSGSIGGPAIDPAAP